MPETKPTWLGYWCWSLCSCELGFFVISNWLCWQCQLQRSFANSHPIPQVCRVSQVNYFSSLYVVVNLVFLWSLTDFVGNVSYGDPLPIYTQFLKSAESPQVNYFSRRVTKMSIFQSNMKRIVMSYTSWFSFVHFQSRVFFRCIHILCRSRFKLQTFPLYIFQVRKKQAWVCVII